MISEHLTVPNAISLKSKLKCKCTTPYPFWILEKKSRKKGQVVVAFESNTL